MADLVYLNGSLLPSAEARIAALDYGFLYGYGLFETMRAYGGRVFRLGRHLDRLVSSAETLGITVDTPTLKDAIHETLSANNLSSARIRLTVSAGEGDPAPDLASCARPTVLIVAGEYQPLPEDAYAAGYRAVTASLRRNHRSPLAGMKSLN
ncbi:MAG: aminotransferase class IV, partial [Dehalococcoidales bacterium]